MVLGKKQTTKNEDFVEVWNNIERHVTKQQLDEKIDHAVAETREVLKRHSRPVFGWSGGKDSQALIGVMRRAGVEGCLMGMTNLEYPEFLQWVTDNMPDDLEIFNNGDDLAWLATHQSMLFPQDSPTAAKWFKRIQHKAQHLHCQKHGTDLLILGRRRADGNWMGRDGSGYYQNAEKHQVYCPIRDWTHEDVMAFCHYYNTPLPPIYHWPNGWQVGTGCWAARQYTGSIENGWREVFSIDPSIVHSAAALIPSARAFLSSQP
jgi:3'-phosphoadenosine 5'-phosphosulfate sulfotransferase (PAPS reductase)/FAD synthetase